MHRVQKELTSDTLCNKTANT